MIVRPRHMNCLTVVMNKSNFAFVKFSLGNGYSYFGPPPLHLMDDWRWKCEREKCIAEARIWVSGYPHQGTISFEGLTYSFGPGCEYEAKENLPTMIRMAYEWLWVEVLDHDMNLHIKRQEVSDQDY